MLRVRFRFEKLQFSRTLTSALRHSEIRYTRRFFGGRQPLCGSGVTSSMPVIFRPAFWSCGDRLLAAGAGALHLHFDFHHPVLAGLRSAAFSAARPAANGVLLRRP